MAEFLDKIKPYQNSLFLIISVIMVGLIGFGLGRLSAKYQVVDLKINSNLVNATDLEKIVSTEKNIAAKKSQPVTAAISATANVASGEVLTQKIVGNKQSKIYHLENCPGALKMKAENKIFFASIIDAQNAGFKPAGNCPGLQ